MAEPDDQHELPPDPRVITSLHEAILDAVRYDESRYG